MYEIKETVPMDSIRETVMSDEGENDTLIESVIQDFEKCHECSQGKNSGVYSGFFKGMSDKLKNLKEDSGPNGLVNILTTKYQVYSTADAFYGNPVVQL